MTDLKNVVILRGFDVFDVVKFIGRINKKFQAVLLSQLEEVIEDTNLYLKVRKLILDSFNNYTRSIITSIFGDIDS